MGLRSRNLSVGTEAVLTGLGPVVWMFATFAPNIRNVLSSIAGRNAQALTGHLLQRGRKSVAAELVGRIAVDRVIVPAIRTESFLRGEPENPFRPLVRS